MNEMINKTFTCSCGFEHGRPRHVVDHFRYTEDMGAHTLTVRQFGITRPVSFGKVEALAKKYAR